MIDILMAVYNAENYLAEQLDSIFAQTFQDWRLIIGDDGSQDSTMQIVRQYQSEHPDKITYYSSDQNGSSPQKNFFRLICCSKSPYLMTCDHDDVWLPEKVEKTWQEMQRLEQKFPGTPVLVHTDLKVVDQNLNVISESMFSSQKLNRSAHTLRELIVQNHVTGCTMMINRALADKVTRLPEEALMHDWWYALAAAAFGEIGFVDEPLILYRQHGANQVGAKSASDLGALASRAVHKREVQQAMNNTYTQAKAFLKQYESELSKEDKQLLISYLSIPAKSKLHRWQTLISRRFYKYGFARKIGQFIYI